ncbi:MAG: lipid-A-disaccharide synthase [Candidatus Omnitrophota bacterium]
MAEIKNLMIICGEPSGDLHAGNLAQEIKKLNPAIKITGVGGASLKRSADEIICDIKELAVFGFFDVIKKLPRFFRLKRTVLEKIEKDRPDALILVDFSGFNLRLAKAINKKITVIYYVSPQVWASRKGRLKTIKKYIHKMVVLFKFEEEFYHKCGIDAVCAGHPLLDIVTPSLTKQELLSSLKFSPHKKTIALLPGSRNQEIKNILPIMLAASSIIARKIPSQFIIAKSPHVEENIYLNEINRFKLDVKMLEGKTYDCLEIADFCLVCSGTATLETAIMQKPFCIVYKMNTLNYLLYRPQVKVPYIGMVNIVAGENIIPEFIQFKANPAKIAEEALNILNNPDRLRQIKEGLFKVKASLGENGAGLRAAKIILDYLTKQ